MDEYLKGIMEREPSNLAKAMSGEQRVTDEVGAIIDRCVIRLANTPMNMSLEEWGEISNALLGVDTAYRATEAKLTAALAELADLRAACAGASYTKGYAAGHAAALAATKAKLEAAEDALRKFYATFPEKHYLPASDRDWTDANACPHCYEPDMSVDTHRPDCPYVATRAALTTQEAPDGR